MGKILVHKYKKFMPFFLLFLSGFLIRTFLLNHSLSSDEALSLIYYILPASSPLDVLVTPLGLFIHPLAAFNVSVMENYFSDALFVLRLPNFIIGLIAFPTFYLFTKKHYGEKEALIVIFVLAFSLAHIRFSTETRGYSGMITFSILLLFVTMQIAEKSNIWNWLSFTALVIINSYNHLSSFFLLGVSGAFLALLFLKDYIQKNRSGLETLRQFFILIVCSVISLTCISYFYSFQGFPLGQLIITKIIGATSNSFSSSEGHIANFISKSESNLTWNFYYKLFTEFAVGDKIPSLIQFILFISGIWIAMKKNSQVTFLLFLTFAFPLLLAEMFNVNFSIRHYSFLLIPYWIFLAISGNFLFNFLKAAATSRFSKKTQNGVSAIIIFVFIWIYAPLNIWLGPNLVYEIYSRIMDATFYDANRATNYIKKHIKEGEVILNVSETAIPPDNGFSRYYLKELYKNHALENIFSQKKGVRTWFIGNIEKDKPFPYFFPTNFQPKLVSSGHGYNIYVDDNLKIWSGSLDEDIKKSPPFWLFLKGWFFFRTGQYHNAIKYFDHFVKIPNVKNIRRGFNNLALAYLSIGKIDLAINNLKKALSTDPKLDSNTHIQEFSAPLFNLGILLCGQSMKNGSIIDHNKYQEGLKYIQQGMGLLKLHRGQSLFIDALNGKIVDFKKAPLTVNEMVSPLSYESYARKQAPTDT